MIGTGVFTSVGFQLNSVQNSYTILLLWVVGGFLALFGAFAYAELGTHFKESGGDYIYLSRVFHPLLGYLSAWAGLTVGFSAPVALAAMAFTKYLAPFGLQGNVWLAVGIIIIILLATTLCLSGGVSSLFGAKWFIRLLLIVGVGLGGARLDSNR